MFLTNTFRLFNLKHTLGPLRYFSSTQKQAIELLDKIHREESKISPNIKRATKVDVPQFNEKAVEVSEEVTFKHSPGKFMKYMDTSLEKFFYQRNYTLENFNFYLQVLWEQYKIEEWEKALSRMQILGIKPSPESYNYLLTAYAKLGNIDKAEEVFSLSKLCKSHFYSQK